MKTLDSIMQSLTGPDVLNALTDLLRCHDKDFPEDEQNFFDAVAFLKQELPETHSPSVDEYISAAQTEVIANLLYAGYEGYRANLDNFHSPYATRFTRLDFSDYIRDHLVGHFPAALAAHNICDQFSKNLPERCQEAADAITSYFIALDVSGPKLAHYAGYMVANRLLPWVVPGYREDYSQTLEYQRELQKYMGYLPL